MMVGAGWDNPAGAAAALLLAAIYFGCIAFIIVAGHNPRASQKGNGE